MLLKILIIMMLNFLIGISNQTQTDLSNTQNELSQTKTDLSNTQNKLSQTQDELLQIKTKFFKFSEEISKVNEKLENNLVQPQYELLQTQKKLLEIISNLKEDLIDASSIIYEKEQSLFKANCKIHTLTYFLQNANSIILEFEE